jgi:excisionase family DNA binding protein
LREVLVHPDDRLLTNPEAALLFRCTIRHLEHLRATGRLPYVRLGHRSIRYRLSDLAEFIEAHAQPATKAS